MIASNLYASNIKYFKLWTNNIEIEFHHNFVLYGMKWRITSGHVCSIWSVLWLYILWLKNIFIKDYQSTVVQNWLSDIFTFWDKQG